MGIGKRNLVIVVVIAIMIIGSSPKNEAAGGRQLLQGLVNANVAIPVNAQVAANVLGLDDVDVNYNGDATVGVGSQP